ncbi:MAG: hypothetical protein NTX48_06740 [Planctomycetales bacterium]|nr:hypothetical protein [Planctomycetales bacterium]
MSILPGMLPIMDCSDLTEEQLESIAGDANKSNPWRTSSFRELMRREQFTRRTLTIFLLLLHELCDKGQCEIILSCCGWLHYQFKPPATESDLVVRICESLRSESLRVFAPLALLIRAAFEDPLVIEEANKILSIPLEFELDVDRSSEPDLQKDFEGQLFIALHGMSRVVVAGKQPLPPYY